jgi:hypothetical protein
MRLLATVLVVLGIVGIAFGVLIMLQGPRGVGGTPFTFENYGGPGPLIAGLMLVAGGLYLRGVDTRRG